MITRLSVSGQISPEQLAFFADQAAAEFVALRSLCMRQQHALQDIAQAVHPCTEALDLLENQVAGPVEWPTATLAGAVRRTLTILSATIGMYRY